MKTLIVHTSVSHGNTRKIADAMAEELEATVIRADEADPTRLGDFDLVGFGSGIYHLDFHPELLAFVESLGQGQSGPAFVFSTSGLPEPPFRRYTARLGARLGRVGLDMVDSFACRGHDTWLPFKPIGGIRKGRPDAADLAAAREFARGLLASSRR